MHAKKSILGMLAVALIIAACGCAPGAMRRPAPGPGPAPSPAAPMPGTGGQGAGNGGSTNTGDGLRQEGMLAYPSPRAGSSYDDTSTGVSTIASAVPGAGRAFAVVLGNVALVGLNTGDRAVHRKVAEQIHTSFPHIAEVRVSADPTVARRLDEIGSRIRTQRTILPYLGELAALSGTMTPAR
ncbi:MAG TPA: YhcN/YlaJ family sporulation lipoprotein [Symbiobacteriaceae bacterium]